MNDSGLYAFSHYTSMNKYLQLFRLGNALIGSFALLIAAFMAAGTGMADHALNLVIGFLVVFTFIAGGNSLNDYIDVEIDKVSHPSRPVPSGSITPIQARNVGILMLCLSMVFSLFTFDAYCIVIVVVACVFMASYELYLKQRGFVGNLVIALLTGLVFILAGALVGNVIANVAVGGMAALVSVGREIAKDIEDMEGDVGRKTLPMSIGVRNASTIAAIFFIAGPVLSWYPIVVDPRNYLYYVVVVADVIFFYCAYKVFDDPRKAEKKAKLGMLFGLFAFILGAIYNSFLV